MKYLVIKLNIIKFALLSVLMLAALSCTGTDDARTAGTGAPRASPTGLIPNATISEVIDGDTVIAYIKGSRETVRLIGIDTPESVARNRPDQCYGAEASSYLKSLLPEGTSVTLILDEEARDQYDRLLAYVIRSRDDLFVNLDLVDHGYAGTLSYPPNTHYEQLLDRPAKKATLARVGLWGVCGNPDVPLE
ncbi:MAG: thermonuclease [Acidimicrobiaceae bacterium]|nr:thermonuclease [Acidimicrobiaceae bacterium]MYC43595.1 thermonuclease [Acidimicrobiaceae bacterium]